MAYLFLALLLYAAAFAPVNAVCCFPPYNLTLHKYICSDGTTPTGGSECCGYRSCNMFCCACGGGCRIGPYSKRDVLPAPTGLPFESDACSWAEEGRDCSRRIFARIDAGGKGGFDVGQYVDWVNESIHGGGMPEFEVQRWRDRFDEFDGNGDGWVDAEEVFRPIF